MQKVFILSPAKTSGERAKLIFNPGAKFALARRLQSGEAVSLSEVFSFLSGLYFRGKFTYANAFNQPPRGLPGVLVVTSHRGLLPVEVPVGLDEIRAFSDVAIEPAEERYVGPLRRDAEILANGIGLNCRVVFLGSISTPRYVEPLLRSLGERLFFPPSFVGRGDMSRGGLLLRAVAEKRELEYARLAGAVRRGKRPAKLPPRSWGYQILDGTTRI